ncbi:MAG: bifunctional heptose 7-phosphate kinase/heptose 1-phosphate adenyltransferase [Caldicoprobacterales bacterium]
MQHTDIIKSVINRELVLDILEKIKTTRIGIIGDGCLDIYWDADMRLSVLSRETPHFPLPVVRERIYPGAGGNVAANVRSLQAGSTYILSCIGKDWRGESLLSVLAELGIDTRFMLTDDNWITPAYCKPVRQGYSDVKYEDPRIDFENRTALSLDRETELIDNLTALSKEVDVLIVCDQFNYGVIGERVCTALAELAGQGRIVVADSRTRIGLFRNVIIKPNELEARMAVNQGEVSADMNFEDLAEAAVRLYERNSAPVVITMGSGGSLWYSGEKLHRAESIPVEPPIDIVGAGDTFLAAFSCAYGAGFSGPACIAFANLASSVVIQKIGMTGTASPDEIIEASNKLLSGKG